MTGGVADVFQVAVLATGAHALLAAGRAGVGALFLAKEAVLELVHPRVGEQQGRVVARNQGAGGNSGMSLLFEEAKEGFTDFCAFHRFFHGNGGPEANACVKLTKRRQRAALYRALGSDAVCLCYRNRQLDALQPSADLVLLGMRGGIGKVSRMKCHSSAKKSLAAYTFASHMC
ncbi:hypothetical protein D3C78_476360 [compost metagenome]